MKYVKSGALLLLFDALFDRSQKQEANQTTYQSLPQVQSTLLMRLQTSTIAVTKAKLTVAKGLLEEGRILDTPTNLQKPFYDSGINIAYPQMVSKVSIRHQRLLPTKLNSRKSSP